MNHLEHIMGVAEASRLWGLSADRIKALCASGKIISKKIGNSWAILIDQPNPSSHKKSPDR